MVRCVCACEGVVVVGSLPPLQRMEAWKRVKDAKMLLTYIIVTYVAPRVGLMCMFSCCCWYLEHKLPLHTKGMDIKEVA